MTNENTVKEIKAEKLYEIAQSVANGEIGDFVYCLHNGRFYMYEKGVWKELFEIEFLSKIQEGIIRELRFKSTDDKWHIQKGKILTKYTPSRKKQIIEHFKLIKYKSLEDFNKSHLINLENYMIDPIGNNICKHDKEFYSTIRLPYQYNNQANCELWIKTLLEIFEGNIDIVNSLQEYFGYCLTRDTSQIMALLLIGESKSGKSTIIHVLRHMIGLQNCSSVSMKDISNPQYTPLLINKLVNIDSDVSEKSQDFEAQFKIITSGEQITCNQKFIPTFEFVPYCKIIMAANRFPRITDHSSAFYNRLLAIPCDRVFLPSEQDRTLKVKLLEELPGILLWAIKGLHKLNKRGMFEEKDFIKEAIEELREESNPVDVFFRDHIETDVNGDFHVEKGEIYIKYSLWCKENGNAPMSSIKFGQAIYQKYSKFTPKKSQDHATGKRVWRNLRYVDKKLNDSIKQEVHWQDTEPVETVSPHIPLAIEAESKQVQSDINWES